MSKTIRAATQAEIDSMDLDFYTGGLVILDEFLEEIDTDADAIRWAISKGNATLAYHRAKRLASICHANEVCLMDMLGC